MSYHDFSDMLFLEDMEPRMPSTVCLPAVFIEAVVKVICDISPLHKTVVTKSEDPQLIDTK